MQPLSGNQQPDLLASLMNIEHVSCTAPATRNPSLQIFFKCPMPAIVFEMQQNPDVFLTFGRVENTLRLPHKTTLQRPKVARTCDVLYILTSKCASRHSGVRFLNISTPKSAPRLRCFLLRATTTYIFRHLNFQKWSENGLFCTF